MIATAALGFFGAALTSTALAQGAGCTGGGKISKQIAKPMAAAQEAMKAKRWQEVLTKTKEAESTPGAKTQTDLYWMSEFRGYAYHSLKQDGRCRPRTRKRAQLAVYARSQEARTLQEHPRHLLGAA
jgi:hypothetical protein